MTQYLVKNPSLYWRSSVAVIIFAKLIPELKQKFFEEKTVWDLGAGDQPYKNLLGESYRSMDISVNRSNVDVLGDIQLLPFKSNTIQALFSAQVLEHVPRPWEAFSEFERVLESGGVGIITVPHLGYLHNVPHDYYRFTEYGLKSLVLDAGLEVCEIQSLGGLFCFFGYIRSTVIQPLYGLPIVGRVILEANYIVSRVEVFVDRFFRIDTLFPLNYLIVFRKK